MIYLTMSVNNCKEHTFTTNNFKEPNILYGQNAVGTLILRLLILEPGKNPIFPDMGVGIGTIYRYITEDQLPGLKDRITMQLQTYLPEYQTTSIALSIIGKILKIEIAIEGVVYTYTSDAIKQLNLATIEPL